MLLFFFVFFFRILPGLIESLNTQHQLREAHEIVLTGTSAGGLATYLNANRFNALLETINCSASVTVLADAGFFLDHRNVHGKYAFRENFERAVQSDVWNGTLEGLDSCSERVGKDNESLCWLAQNALPFVTLPVFIINSLYDSYQVKINTCTCII